MIIHIYRMARSGIKIQKELNGIWSVTKVNRKYNIAVFGSNKSAQEVFTEDTKFRKLIEVDSPEKRTCWVHFMLLSK